MTAASPAAQGSVTDDDPPMDQSSSRKRVAKNAVWNWAGMAVQMVSGFIVAPYLIHHLGESTYGLWILIASLTGYFRLLDLGMRGSVGRNMAFSLAQDDRSGINQLASTAMLAMTLVAVATLAATAGVERIFFDLIDVPEDQTASVRVAIAIVGGSLALAFPFSLFDAALWSAQRFDLLNRVDISVTVVRTAATFYVIASGFGLLGLAMVSLVTTILDGGSKAWLTFKTDPAMRMRCNLVTRQAARCLYGYGFWCFVMSATRNVTPQLGLLIVGALLPLRMVTSYSIASRLVGYVSSIIIAGSGVLTPVATAMYANRQHERLGRLFLTGGRYCLTLSLLMLGGLSVLARPLIGLWIGHSLEESSTTALLIIAAGEILPMSQWVTCGMILAMGRHRYLALMSLCELLMVAALVAALAKPFGVVGVALAFAIPAAVFRGVASLVFACRLVQLPIATYLRSAVLLPAVMAVIPLACLAAVAQWHSPASWLELGCYGTGYCLVFLATLRWLAPDYFRIPRPSVVQQSCPPEEFSNRIAVNGKCLDHAQRSPDARRDANESRGELLSAASAETDAAAT